MFFLKVLVIFAAFTLFYGSMYSAGLRYEGSSTIGDQLLPELAEAFAQKTGIQFSKIGKAGSGKGFEALLENEADIAGLSRYLSEAEMTNQVYYQIIGYDAIVVYVHEDNPVRNLDAADVQDLFTGKVPNWKKLGWQNQPVEVVTEMLDGKRATIKEFQLMALGGKKIKSTKEIDKPSDCVDYTANNKYAVTFATLSFNRKGVRYLRYNNISPTIDDIISGAYPLSRPLVLATKKIPKGDLKRFIVFVLSPEGQQIVGKYFAPVLISHK